MPRGVYTRKTGDKTAKRSNFTPVIVHDKRLDAKDVEGTLRLANEKIRKLEGENVRLRQALNALIKGDQTL